MERNYTDDSGYGGLSEIALRPTHAALLFVLFGQAPPPLVAEALAGFPTFMFREKMRRVEAEMVEQGLLRRDDQGELGLSQGAADLLSVCFEAAVAVSIESLTEDIVTVYVSDDRVVTVTRAEDEILLAERDAVDAAWLPGMLAERVSQADGEPLHATATAEQLEQLLAAWDSSRVSVARVCTDNGWDPAMAGSAVEAINSVLLKATTVRPDIPGLVLTRLAVSPSGCWAMQMTALGDEDRAEFGWYPDSELAGLLWGSTLGGASEKQESDVWRVDE